jgi:Ca2+-binding EF-hand superfamily protein
MCWHIHIAKAGLADRHLSVNIFLKFVGAVQQKFEDMFSKYDHGNKGYLTLSEVWEMTQAHRNVLDPTGW